MKLGYPLRRFNTFALDFIRNSFNITYYFLWLLFDFSKFKKIKTENIKNLLVIYSAHLGDMANACGIINKLKEKYPDVKVYFLATKEKQNFIVTNLVKKINREEAKNLIRQGKIDAVILLHGGSVLEETFDKEMKKLIKKIPYRVSCDTIQVNPKLFFKHAIPLPLTRKVYTVNTNGFIDHLKCFQALGFKVNDTKFVFSKNYDSFISNFLKKYKIKTPEKIVFLHPGSGKAVKALEEGKPPSSYWPTKNWAELADLLIERHNCRIIITGVKKESVIVDGVISQIKHKDKVINLANKTTIEELTALFTQSNLLISIDTASVHLCAQLKIPIIDLYGPLTPKGVRPLGKSIDMFHPEVCTGCRKYACPEGNNLCMKSITTKEVLKAADKYLSKK